MRAHGVVLYGPCHLSSVETGRGEGPIWLPALTKSPVPALFHPLKEAGHLLLPAARDERSAGGMEGLPDAGAGP